MLRGFSSAGSRRLLQAGDAHSRTDMAAAVRTGTWSRPTTAVFYPWAVLFFVLLGAIEAVDAAPETGLWKITVVNVSIAQQPGELTAASISLVALARPCVSGPPANPVLRQQRFTGTACP